MTACKHLSFLFLYLLFASLDARITTAAQAQSMNMEAAKKEGKVVLYGML
jgi:hypothetical protein